MRHILSRLCLTILGLAGLSRADYVFPFPAGTYLDSAAVNAAIPMRTFSDSLSSTTLTMTDKVAKLSVSWGNVPKWGANAGIQLPFNNLWAPVDMSPVTAVSFKYKTSDAKTFVQFTPVSDLYPGLRDGVMMVAALGSSAAGTTKTIALPSGITFLKWMKDQHAEDAMLTWDDVKSEINSLQFQPMAVYDSTGDAVTVPSAWLEISEVRVISAGGGCSDIIGFYPGCEPIAPKGTMCKGNSVGLSDFAGKEPLGNAWGGSWYDFVDSAASIPSHSRGISRLLDRNGDGVGLEWVPAADTLPARLSVTALLDKGDVSLHPYAGWAGIGTSIDAGRSGELDGLKAISFRLATDSFDYQNLSGVKVVVRNQSIGDSVRFEKLVPIGPFTNGEVCIDVNQLRQPNWFRQPLPSLPLSDILGFEWEVKIDSDAKEKALPSTFSIGDVKLWGTNAANGISRSRTDKGPALVASYFGALRLSYSLKDAASAKIEVLQMDGRSVASFDAPSSAQAKAFPLALGQGTYLAVVRSGSTKLVAPFAVAR